MGWNQSYSDLLQNNDIEPISERRQRLTNKFTVKATKNPKYKKKWFPLKTFTHHDLRNERFYDEKFAKTDRLYISPIYYYRRILNEIHEPD